MVKINLSGKQHSIIDEGLCSIINAILAMANMIGDKECHEFAKWVCPSLKGNPMIRSEESQFPNVV